MSMFKKNKVALKKIYQEEYDKAFKVEKKKALEREIEQIKVKAREDAKRRAKGRVAAAKKKGKNTRKTMKRVGQRSQDIATRMIDDII